MRSSRRCPRVRRAAEVESTQELAGQRTRLAIQRTRLGADRTLMAIMRTSLSLIGFGFTVFQFLLRMKELTWSTRLICVGLVVIGFACQLLGVWKYVAFRRELGRQAAALGHGDARPSHSLSFGVALLLLLVGLAATVGVAAQAFVD